MWWVIFIVMGVLISDVRADIEVVVNGRLYKSFKEYRLLSQATGNNVVGVVEQDNPSADVKENLLRPEDIQATQILDTIAQQPPEKPLVWRQSWQQPEPQIVLAIKNQHLAKILEATATQDQQAKLIVGHQQQLKVLSLTPEVQESLGINTANPAKSFLDYQSLQTYNDASK